MRHYPSAVGSLKSVFQQIIQIFATLPNFLCWWWHHALMISWCWHGVFLVLMSVQALWWCLARQRQYAVMIFSAMTICFNAAMEPSLKLNWCLVLIMLSGGFLVMTICFDVCIIFLLMMSGLMVMSDRQAGQRHYAVKGSSLWWHLVSAGRGLPGQVMTRSVFSVGANMHWEYTCPTLSCNTK